MQFNEMKEKYDIYNSFYDWLSVEMAFAYGVIPAEYRKHLNNICKCGSEMIIKDNRKYIMCCDPKCPEKEYRTLSEIFYRFGVKGIGDETCKEFYYGVLERNANKIANGEQPLLKTTSPLEMLGLPFDEYPYEFRVKVIGSEFYEACCFVRTRTLTFPGLIQKLAVPELDSTALKLFSGITSISDWVDVANASGGLEMFCRDRGVKDSMLLFWLNAKLEDLTVGTLLLGSQVRNEGLRKLTIVTTGSLTLNGYPITKDALVKTCNEECRNEDGVQLLEIVNGKARESATYIVYSKEDNTESQRAGKARGTFIDFDGVERPVLITVDEMYELIKARYSILNEQYALLKEKIGDNPNREQLSNITI